MKRTITALAVLSLTTLPAFADADADRRAGESRAVAMEFMNALKGELQAAMQAGGPPNAIAVCKDKAPAIAAEKSAATGWRVARTSLKHRNPDNAPDAWERGVLERFDARAAAGEDPKTIEFYEVVESDGGRQFRFMKAIPTAEVCLNCHGQQLKPEVEAALKELYPQDRATGYSLGQIRGAFTIAQPM